MNNARTPFVSSLALTSIRKFFLLIAAFGTAGSCLIGGVLAEELPAAEIKELQEAKSLNVRVFELLNAGKAAEALPLAQKALEIHERLLGSKHRDTATSVFNLAAHFHALRRLPEAEAQYRRALAMFEKVFGPEDPETMDCVKAMGAFFQESGKFNDAAPLFLRVLKMKEKTLGPEHRSTTFSRVVLAEVYRLNDDAAKAEPLLREALAAVTKGVQPESIDTAAVLNNLALVCRASGRFSEAETHYRRALEITEKLRGPKHADLAPMLNNLALFYETTGDFDKAEPLHRRSLEIREAVWGPDHPTTATSLNNLALFYEAAGDITKAAALIHRAVAIWEKSFGPNDLKVGTALHNEAIICEKRGDVEGSIELQRRAQAIREATFGPDHPETASSLSHLALLYARANNFAEVESLHLRSLKICENKLGPDHRSTAGALTNLGKFYERMGRFEESEKFQRRALEIREKVQPEHQETVGCLINMAALRISMNASGANEFVSRAFALQQTNLTKILTFASERERLGYQKAQLSYDFLDVSGTPAEIATTVLRWKGVVLDSVLEDRAVARQAGDAGFRQQLETMQAIKGQMMKLVVETPNETGAEQRVKREGKRLGLEQELADIEREMAQRVTALGRTRRALDVTPAQVQRVLGPREVLVDFVRCARYLGSAKWDRIYAAIIHSARGEPRWLPLGSAAEIDKVVRQYQKSVRGETDETTLERSLKTLSALVWSPVAGVLPDETESVVICPDGPLSFVSFATLLDQKEQFLAEHYTIRYVGSGRDLLRPLPSVLRKELVLYGNPDFGGAASSEPVPPVPDASAREVRAMEFGELKFLPLPGASEECRRVGALATAGGWTVKTYLEADATESALVHQSPPGILHLATHAFFLPEEQPKDGESSGLAASAQRRDQHPVNPMQRSGVALSGAWRTLQAWQARRAPAGGNDGILTADEVAALDLEGTWLVTLSACDTGVGEARSGEGVLGLRRAFAQAGAGNLLMTLWPVNDTMTIDIMEDFYRRALALNAATRALAETQRDWLQKLRSEKGLLYAVRHAGAFLINEVGAP